MMFPQKLKKTNIYKIISGKFKDEMGGKPIKEFIGLRSKMYSILSEAGEQKNTAKGVSRNVSENILTHQDYRNCLFMKKSMKNKMMRFVHDRHQLYTVEQNKTSLSPFNDKRYILENGVSHSFGHYAIDFVGDVDDILCDGNQIALEEEEETPVWYPTEKEQELYEQHMELVDVLDDLICEGNMFL